jgi:probable HAF family extracellular repeat protein
MTDLGTLGGYESRALGINDSGQVVGYVLGYNAAGSETSHAFLYDDDNGMIDLYNLVKENLGFHFITAQDVNNLGQIVGQGIINGQQHAYLLTPIIEIPSTPEPASILLLGLGMLVFTGVSRKKIQKYFLP